MCVVNPLLPTLDDQYRGASDVLQNLGDLYHRAYHARLAPHRGVQEKNCPGKSVNSHSFTDGGKST